MLHLVALAGALALGWATLELRSADAAPAVDSPREIVPRLDLDGGVPRTAKALRAAVARHELDGRLWLGKLRSVGGGRDTLVYTPRDLDTARTIELVVYLEGHGSFADDAMDHRHATDPPRNINSLRVRTRKAA
jgi:hypothetical protein